MKGSEGEGEEGSQAKGREKESKRRHGEDHLLETTQRCHLGGVRPRNLLFVRRQFPHRFSMTFCRLCCPRKVQKWNPKRTKIVSKIYLKKKRRLTCDITIKPSTCYKETRCQTRASPKPQVCYGPSRWGLSTPRALK